MNSYNGDNQSDEVLAQGLGALHALPTATEVTALRGRILREAAEPLAARARIAMRVMTRPTWLDVTGGFGRIAIPLSLAALLLAMVLLREAPLVADTEEPTMSLSYDLTYLVADQSGQVASIAEQLLMPENADEVLLAPLTPRVPQ